jgi:hypothetical protein
MQAIPSEPEVGDGLPAELRQRGEQAQVEIQRLRQECDRLERRIVDLIRDNGALRLRQAVVGKEYEEFRERLSAVFDSRAFRLVERVQRLAHRPRRTLGRLVRSCAAACRVLVRRGPRRPKPSERSDVHSTLA